MPDSQNQFLDISQYYDYWDAFVRDNFTANELCDSCRHLQINLLPEPWWGWNNTKDTPLNSVVINFNPSLGDCVQCGYVLHRRYGRNFSYREIMPDFRLHHPQGEKWHKNRASAIRNLIVGLIRLHHPQGEKWCKDCASAIKNLIVGHDRTNTFSHLSIELYPFHSNSVEDDDIEKYLKDNSDDVIKNVFEFAACAASHIECRLLRKIVFVRISPVRFCQYLDKLNLKYEQQIETKHFTCFKILNFTDKYLLKNVNFITATGARNHFPYNEEAQDNFNEILNKIIY